MNPNVYPRPRPQERGCWFSTLALPDALVDKGGKKEGVSSWRTEGISAWQTFLVVFRGA